MKFFLYIFLNKSLKTKKILIFQENQMIYAANWKMNGDKEFVHSILTQIKDNILPFLSYGSGLILCPPSIYLSEVVEISKNTSIEIGAQDCSAHENGAFTGEVSAQMISDIGAEWVILGHSERRQYHAENNILLADKLRAANNAGLKVIYCVGETNKQYDEVRTKETLKSQLSVLDSSSLDNLNYIIAYEPVWAIGTGLLPELEEIDFIHQFIKTQLIDISNLSKETRILYGGSVNPDNAEDIKSLDGVDGVLIGGASLSSDKFKQICI